jgi:Zn-dependent M28 family amino/carboxypeptidase
MKNVIFLILVVFIGACSGKYNPAITADEMRTTVEYLASDSLKGRKAGSEGDLLAAGFIREQFENTGLELMFENGFQTFGLVSDAELGEENMLEINGETFEVGKDFSPYAFSANTTVEALVVFAGFGLDVDKDTLQWNDFEDADISGKWVLALQGDPDLNNSQSPFIPFSTERAKALNASDRNAAGLILVAGSSFSETDELSSLFFDKNVSRYSIPVIQVTRKVANRILAESGKTIEELEAEMLEQQQPVSFETDVEVKAAVNVLMSESESQNVVALLPGRDEQLKNEYLVVGAHYDHLGMGGPGSGSRALDTVAVHYGADDNASGVAAVIELAEKMAAEGENKRSVIFAAFGAEEMGLIGSKAFTADPPVDVEKIVAMFNFDMIGRLDTTENSLSIGGTKTAIETEDLLNQYNSGFKLAFSGEGIGPSDHASFYLQNIPVFFISTGAHPDYHTPNDAAHLLNYEGAVKVTRYAAELVSDVASRDSLLTFQEAGPKYQRSMGRFKVTLGIMPDYAGLEDRGLRIDAVSKGKPADKGGMQKGDIITAIDGKKVGNIYDYMNRLQTLEAGQIISVDIIRDEKEKVLLIQL